MRTQRGELPRAAPLISPATLGTAFPLSTRGRTRGAVRDGASGPAVGNVTRLGEHAPFDPLEHGVMAGGTPFQPKQGSAPCEFSSFRAKRAANCIQRAMKKSFPFCAICLSLHRKSDMHAWRSKCGHQFCKQCSEGLRQQSTVACPPPARSTPLPTSRLPLCSLLYRSSIFPASGLLYYS